MKTFDLLLPDESATAAWAASLAHALAAEPLAEQSFVVHLSGDLGAGKTALARAILRGLGFSGPVKSPTYTLLEPYNLPNFPVYHFDLYRFASSDQWFDAGFDDVLAGPGLMLIEWPEKAAGALAEPDLLLAMVATAAGAAIGTHASPDERRLQGRAFSAGACRCLSRMAPMTSTRPLPPAAAGADAGS